MGVIAIYSPKGGVGKTTISVDLGWRFSVAGQKTLIWDLDTQGGAGFLLQMNKKSFVNDPAVLKKPRKLREFITLTDYDNLFYVGIDRSLRNLPFNLLKLGPKKRITDLIRNLSGTFERIVLDCPPVRNEVSDQIMRASDLMIVPLPVSPLAARALDQVMDDLAERNLKKIPVLPIFSMYDSRRKAHRLAREGWMAQFPVIPSASQIEQSAFRRAPIGTFADHCGASKALDRLWRGTELKLAELGR